MLSPFREFAGGFSLARFLICPLPVLFLLKHRLHISAQQIQLMGNLLYCLVG